MTNGDRRRRCVGSLKWLLDEPDSALAEALRVEDLVAPDLLRLECANAVLKRVRLKQLTFDEALQHLDEIALFPVRFVAADERAAVDLALALTHPVYDCIYLALARTLNLQVVTADQRFAKAVAASSYAASIRLLAPVQ